MTNNLISLGNNILSPSDSLEKVQVETVYHLIKESKPSLQSKIRQLRVVRDLDRRRYSELKRQLPYLVCGIFNPAFRKTDNFAYTNHFIIDIDHVQDNGKNMKELRSSLESDPRVLLSFVSPGEDGIKLLFRLNERCWDSGIYSLFYKTFAKAFAIKYSIRDILDTRTSDVSRACFLSMDPDVFYNPDAEAVDINSFINQEDVSSMLNLKLLLEKEEKELTANAGIPNISNGDPDNDTMLKIKNLLSGKVAAKEEQSVYVPLELDLIMEKLSKAIQDTGVELVQISNIQYGKNLQMRLGLKKAEINLFFGKRGFTVVECPRTGTNPEFNHLCRDFICSSLKDLT